MKHHRPAALLLASVLALSSCGIITVPGGAETAVPLTEPPETDFPPITDVFVPTTLPLATEADYESVVSDRLSALPDADLDGQTVFFAVSDDTGFVFDDESERYRAEIIKRNQAVEAKYQTRIVAVTAAPETMLSQTDLADKSGDFFADFAVLPSHDFGGYLTGDYLLNLRSLPFTDYTAPYFDRQAMSQFTFRGVMYAAVGEATVQPEDDLCLFFNRDLAETTGFGFDSESVEWGTFTWDLLLTALSAATDPEDGTYVRFVSRFDAPLTAAFACSSAGVTFLAPDANGLLRQSVNTDAGQAMLETMKSFLPHLTVPEEDPFAVFAGGRALLAIGTLSDVEKLGTAGFRWELLPFPKAEETAEYVTPVTTNAPVVTALSSSVNIDITGYVLQAVNAASAGRFLPVYEAILLRDYVTEARTLDRIDLICRRTAADTALSFGSVKAVREGTYQAFYEAALGTKTLAKALSAKKKALTQYLDRLG